MLSSVDKNQQNCYTGKEINGVVSADGNGIPIVSATQCNMDTFSISSPGNPSPPVICGKMSKEHSKI